MKKTIVLLLTIIITTLAGCSNEQANTEEAKAKKDQQESSIEQPKAGDQIKDSDIVASVDGKEFNGKDLRYEMKRLELIYALQGDKATTPSPKVAIQELIRNEMTHYIAQEQGITVSKNKQTDRVKTVRENVENTDAYMEVMQGVDEEEFWSSEKNRYEGIIQTEKLMSMLMEEVKKEHPDYKKEALRFDAREDLEEWIQEKTAEATVEVQL
ncbi:hypothetical protein GWK91_15215 [Virgibacillus sp. MSP4-1]|uniref:hypothetical protein n=1 Tax=Virgibacillus sp. MSP4-1 TaxID=2700081 RepID=UPI000399A5A2|nr:hypothetical protein [Virgibacillus sp. MSP4-1]QHS24167.1 hypothetical protein GWK91_15215 [Virgibacillus sp. MSP4-1]